MKQFDEGDLFSIAQQAGFIDVQVTLELKRQDWREGRLDWSAMKHSSPNPLAPTIAQAMKEVLTDAEAERLEAHLSMNSDSRRSFNQTAVAYVRATKPS